MKILTTGEALELEFIATSGIDKPQPKVDKDKNPKFSHRGLPLLAARGLELVRKDEEGNAIGTESNIFLGLESFPEEGIKFGARYVAAGQVQVTHFVTGTNRLGVSLQIEALEQIA